MKAPSLLLSCLITVLSFSCNTTDKSIEQQSNPFNTDNRERLIAQIESAVDSTIKATNIDYQEYTIKGYLTCDSLTHTLFPHSRYAKTDSELAKHRNCITEYLNWHLRRIIATLLANKGIEHELNVESALTDSLLRAQYKWLQSHFDTTQDYIGSASTLKYFNIEYEMLKLQNSNLKDLLKALTDSTYNHTVQHNISLEIVQTQYRHILFNRIPYYKNDSIYNDDTDRQNFKLEITAWDRLMEQRNRIVGLLNGKVRDAYNIGTYRLMFNRLRQLKNEFETYPIMTVDKQALTLSDSCTYEELMAYPNFTTKWNEYLKQFE